LTGSLAPASMSPGGCRCMARSTPTTGAISRPRRRALDTSSIMCSARLPSLAGFRALLEIETKARLRGDPSWKTRLLLDGDGATHQLSAAERIGRRRRRGDRRWNCRSHGGLSAGKCWPLGCGRRGTPRRTAGDRALHRQGHQSALAHLSSSDRDARNRSGATLCRGQPQRCAPDPRLGRRTRHRV
jgi:hypothetical protein